MNSPADIATMLENIILNSGILTYPDEFWSGMKPEDRAALRAEVADDEVFVATLVCLETESPRRALRALRSEAKQRAIQKIVWLENSHAIYGEPYGYIGTIPRDIAGIIMHFLSTEQGKPLGIRHGAAVLKTAHSETHTWYLFDSLHREDGPAYIFNTGNMRSFGWYRVGIESRVGKGPARIHHNRATDVYYWDGVVTQDPRLIAEVAALSARYNLV